MSIHESLNSIKEGTTVTLVEITSPQDEMSRLAEIGLNPPITITILHNRKNSNSPVLISFKNTHLAIDRKLSRKILVDRSRISQ